METLSIVEIDEQKQQRRSSAAAAVRPQPSRAERRGAAGHWADRRTAGRAKAEQGTKKGKVERNWKSKGEEIGMNKGEGEGEGFEKGELGWRSARVDIFIVSTSPRIDIGVSCNLS